MEQLAPLSSSHHTRNMVDYQPPKEEVLAKLEELLREGATLSLAARATGVPLKDLRTWIEQGAAGTWCFTGAYTRLTAAMAEFRLFCLRKIKADRDWRAAWELLKNAEPYDYGGKPRQLHPTDGIDHVLLLEDRRRKLVHAIETTELLLSRGKDVEAFTKRADALREALHAVEQELTKETT